MAILILFHGIVNWWYFDGVGGNLKRIGRWWSRKRQLLNRGTGVPLQRLFGDKYLRSFFRDICVKKKSSSFLCLSSSSWSPTHHKLHFCSPCVIAGFARPPVWGPDVAPVRPSMIIIIIFIDFNHHYDHIILCHNCEWRPVSVMNYSFWMKTCRSMSKYSHRSHSTSFRSWPGWWWWWWWWWVGGWGGWQ